MDLKEKIEQVLVKYDLMGLIKMGAPMDEYSHEAEDLSVSIQSIAIVRIDSTLENVVNVEFIQKLLWIEFYNQFCVFVDNHDSLEEATKIIGNINKYLAPAQEIYAILKITKS